MDVYTLPIYDVCQVHGILLLICFSFSIVLVQFLDGVVLEIQLSPAGEVVCGHTFKQQVKVKYIVFLLG